MKLLIALVIASMMGIVVASPAIAAEPAGCSHEEATIAALRECVAHAAAMGHIDNAGVTNSLLASLDAAQAAANRAESAVAINQLNMFISIVEAQAGKHIVADHAAMLVEHAEMVINAFSN